MSKEELIKLIESLSIEEVNGVSINYYAEKEERNYGYEPQLRDLKTISYGEDINRKLEYIRRDMDSIPERIQRNNYMMIEEMINEKLERNK